MQYRPLGRSGLKISPICLGTMMFGGPTDEATSGRIIAKAREAGINFIDTADAYNGGQFRAGGRPCDFQQPAELDPRHQARQPDERRSQPGRACRGAGCCRRPEDSLRRLGTDTIDIYYLHKEDHSTPLEETVRAMGDLMRQGKIRYFGVSNYRAWRVAEICNICDRLGIDRPVVSQPYYNAMNRMPEVEHFSACGHYGLGIVPYQPAGARRIDRQIPARRRARQGQPRRPRRQAHDANRMAPRNRCNWRRRSSTTPRPRASRRGNSRWHGC